jgi:hypothetical protein
VGQTRNPERHLERSQLLFVNTDSLGVEDFFWNHRTKILTDLGRAANLFFEFSARATALAYENEWLGRQLRSKWGGYLSFKQTDPDLADCR